MIDLRTRTARVAALVALTLVVVAGACTPPPAGDGPTYREGRCVGTEGVTVIVDFTPFRDEVLQRCALGAQQSGFSVLDTANLDHDPGRYPGSVCQLEGLPAQGHPYCWTTGGYWSYWKAPASGQPWTYSVLGPGAGPRPSLGAVEGWRFAPFSAGAAQPPRVAP